MNNWEKKGPQDQSNWTVDSGGRSVTQSVNGKPVFFVSQKEYINVTIMGTMKVATTSDDDFVGLVVGYSNPDTAPATNTTLSYQMILFDWKQSDQSGADAFEGFALHQLNGEFDTSQAQFGHYFWAHSRMTLTPSSGNFTTLITDYDTSKGWQDNVEHNFMISHTTNAVKVRIDDQLIFNYSITASSGNIGFYNNSQASVVYGDVYIAPASDTASAPVATADIYGVSKGSSISKTRNEGLIINDYDPNLDDFRINIESSGNYTGSFNGYDDEKIFQTSGGNITLSGNGKFTYTPDTHYTGLDSFTYSLTDKWTSTPDGTSDNVLAQFYVSDNNTAPHDISITTSQFANDSTNNTLVGILTASDVDVGDQHDFILDAQSNTGLFILSGNSLLINDSSKIGSIGDIYTITANATDLSGGNYAEQLSLEVVGRTPVLSGVGGSYAYGEGNTAIPLDTDISLSDFDNSTLSSANAWISGNFLSGDNLSVTTSGTNITASFDDATGLLTLSGNDTLSNYETVLESLTYSSNSENPTESGNKTGRVVELRLNDGSNISSSGNFDIAVTGVDDTPALSAGSEPVAASIAIGVPYTFSVTGTEPDGDTLTYTASGLPPWATIDSSTGQITGTPEQGHAGERYDITITASDPNGNSDILEVSLATGSGTLSNEANKDTASLTVNVCNVDGVAIQGAKVVYVGSGQTGYTDSNGQIILLMPNNENIPATLTASASGYKSNSWSGTISPGHVQKIILNASGVSLTGTVKSTDGTSLNEAVITAYHPSHGYFQAEADKNGSYSLIVPSPSESENWTVGADAPGYAEDYTSVQINPGDTSKSLDSGLSGLSAGPSFSWSAHKPTIFPSTNEYKVSVTSDPPFSNGDERTATIGNGATSGQANDLGFEPNDKAIEFDYPAGVSDQSINFPFSATPTGSSEGTTTISFFVSPNTPDSSDATEASTQNPVNQVSGGSGDLSREKVQDENGNDITDNSGFEIPPFGIREKSGSIKMDRKKTETPYQCESTLSNTSYVIAPYAVVNGEQVEVTDGSMIQKIYITLNYNKNQWRPYVDPIYYSEDNGKTWISFDISNIVYVDYEKSTVTIESTHASYWCLANRAEGFLGLSATGGGCLLNYTERKP